MLIEDELNIEVDIDESVSPELEGFFKKIKRDYENYSDYDFNISGADVQRIRNYCSWQDFSYVITHLYNENDLDADNAYASRILEKIFGESTIIPEYHENISQFVNSVIDDRIGTLSDVEIALLKYIYRYSINEDTICDEIVSQCGLTELFYSYFNQDTVALDKLATENIVNSINSAAKEGMADYVSHVNERAIRKLRHPSRSKRLTYLLDMFIYDTEISNALTIAKRYNTDFTIDDFVYYYSIGMYKQINPINLARQLYYLGNMRESLSNYSVKRAEENKKLSFAEYISNELTGGFTWVRIEQSLEIPHAIQETLRGTEYEAEWYCSQWGEDSANYLVKLSPNIGTPEYRYFTIQKEIVSIDEKQLATFVQRFDEMLTGKTTVYFLSIPNLEKEQLEYFYDILQYVMTQSDMKKTKITGRNLLACKELCLFELRNEIEWLDPVIIKGYITQINDLMIKYQIEMWDMSKLQSLTIEELDLSVRTYNCLKRAGINTILDILNYSENELRKIRNLDQRSYMEVIEQLKQRKIYLEMLDIIDE